ncbi:MAG: methylamine utilization protein MauG [Gammaproteobacteria bacterium]|nr:MAG: methylamine utilization protein MauG [Gammaproteobacteria bacterium]
MAKRKNPPSYLRKLFVTLLISSFAAFSLADQSVADKQIGRVQSKKESLGLALFFDVNLSKNRTMSCSTCHDPNSGFVDLRGNGVDSMASLGDDGHSIGDRNAPTASYAMFSPHFQANKGKNKKESAFIGGQFLDGREPTLAGQAGGPPLNPIEMGMPDKASVVARLKENPGYVTQFKTIYGDSIFDDVDKAYTAMTEAIESFEETDFFAPFDSKYDRFLRGEYELTVLEDLGRSLFFSNNNTNCSTCHKLRREDDPRETFTNFEYRNIGVPENVALRAKNGVTAKDLGLYQNPKAQTDDNKGKFKVSTLRNIAVTGPYMHNGVFKDLRTVVEFYDKYNNPKRQINPETGKPWGDPEVSDNIALEELKSKALTDRKIDALVAFMKTLTDRRYEHLLEK